MERVRDRAFAVVRVSRHDVRTYRISPMVSLTSRITSATGDNNKLAADTQRTGIVPETRADFSFAHESESSFFGRKHFGRKQLANSTHSCLLRGHRRCLRPFPGLGAPMRDPRFHPLRLFPPVGWDQRREAEST